MARILVVDDNAELLQMIRMLLEERGGHEVMLSAEGEDGLAKARAHPPDLAIIDVMMPGMNGYEVCRQLRQNPATAHIPIIILTARGQPVDREAAMAAGADDYIAKPVTMAELLERVNRLLTTKVPRRATGGTIAVLGLRGGVGVTTLSVNLALTLTRSLPNQVCLLDLSPASGHGALQLGLRPDPNWSALALLTTGPGSATIRNYLLVHASGLHLLASPMVPLVGEGLRRERVMAILTALGESFPAIVVDLPTILTEGAMTVLEVADTILLVTTADPASLQTTLGTLQVLKLHMPKVRLILNQPGPGPLPSVEALQRVLRYPFSAVIPFDPAQARALAQGKPLAIHAPEAPLAQAVAQLASKLETIRIRK
ncbi:MAG: response regulator [Anaerolineae bacterium]|nr:response regulator [Anaerolineae bacterium]MDW8069549.1 response regulator [Anaerolineae bacterium]